MITTSKHFQSDRRAEMKRISDRKQRNILNKAVKGLQRINKQYAGRVSFGMLNSYYPRQQREFRKLLGF
jgi:hypothetical protein